MTWIRFAVILTAGKDLYVALTNSIEREALGIRSLYPQFTVKSIPPSLSPAIIPLDRAARFCYNEGRVVRASSG